MRRRITPTFSGDWGGSVRTADGAGKGGQALPAGWAPPDHHRPATRRSLVNTQAPWWAGGRTSVRFGRNIKSNTSGRYQRTYTPPWSAYQNCTPMTTAALWA